ncbi:MAG: alcohol dehydrogenase catalytic domain-containing protein [Acidimicrobiia bacterium]|nr:alcohol dehydrogenase catalytic domain-containing protein [Acidimicrobiia bacterium]MDH5615320.1 alcohol dehydrogenase catalytic domain-containing protein [Acidimicrobiia bacterium]
MKAWVLHDISGPQSFVLEDVETPDPGPGEVRVKLAASALNHLDIWSSLGLPKPHLPHVAGADGAGVIDAIGEGVSSVNPGQEVVVNPSVGCGTCPACLRGDTPLCSTYQILGEHRWGTLAEYVVVPERNVLPKPDQLGWEEAAAYGLVTGTAYRMLRRARLSSGDVLLVVGVGGGVSSAGLALGKTMGATVYVTSTNTDKICRAIQLGATGGFNSTNLFAKDLKQEIGRGADVVLENVGPATWEQSVRSLEPGGRLVTCGSTSGTKVEITVPHLFFKQLEILGSTMFDYAEFAAVTNLIGSGRVPVVIDKIFDFGDLPAALARLEAGQQLGKIVLRA